MLYADYLKNEVECPFCDKGKRIITEGKHAFLTYSIAPYTKHHLLVLPKRHIESILDLMKEESEDIENLLRVGARLLQRFGHQGFSVLVRNGDAVGRSKKHLHYNLIPQIHIGSSEFGGLGRKVLTSQEIETLLEECQTLLATL